MLKLRRASAVPVEIVYNGGVVTNYVDMTKLSGKWNKIGAWPFLKGTSGSVRILTSGAAGKYVIADAVKFAIIEEFEPSDDSDRNGLSDAWERQHFLRTTGTDPNADPDGDGQSNSYEYVAGFDPNVMNRPFVIKGLETLVPIGVAHWSSGIRRSRATTSSASAGRQARQLARHERENKRKQLEVGKTG